MPKNRRGFLSVVMLDLMGLDHNRGFGTIHVEGIVL